MRIVREENTFLPCAHLSFLSHSFSCKGFKMWLSALAFCFVMYGLFSVLPNRKKPPINGIYSPKEGVKYHFKRILFYLLLSTRKVEHHQTADHQDGDLC